MPPDPTLDLTMAQLIDGWPAAAAVLARHGMACVGCTMAKFETIAEATAAYGVDASRFLKEMERATTRVTRDAPYRRRDGQRSALS